MRREGEYWMKFLSEEEKERFLYNVNGVFEIDWYLSTRFLTFEEFLKSSFLWFQTAEGHDYWSGVCESVKGLPLLKPNVK